MTQRWQHMAMARAAHALLVVGMLAGVSTSMAVQPASAWSPTSVSVSGGSLSVTAPAVTGFAVVVLDGTAQTADVPLEPFWVTDARGSGQGWTLRMQATPFREWDGASYVPDGKSLPHGSLILDGLSVTPDGADAQPPAVVRGPYTLDGPEVTVAAATHGTGMGTFGFHPSSALAVHIPAHAYARTYRSELTISVTSGP